MLGDELPKQQEKILRQLELTWKRSGQLPSPSDLARTLGVTYGTLYGQLKALAKKGYVVFESRGVGKPPRLELPHRTRGVPVLGHIPAGPLSEALEHPEGFLRLPQLREHFGLFVRGDSMADLLQDGDLVILRRGPPEWSGQICAVRLDHSEATLKYLDWRGESPSTLALRPHNPHYETRQVPATGVEVDGVFESSLRGPVIGALLEEPVMN